MSRRTILRGGLIGLGAAVFSPALIACSKDGTPGRTGLGTRTPSGPEALFGHHGAPGGRHLSFGPDPTTQMRVAWQVASPVQEPFVRVGSTDGDLDSPIAARTSGAAHQRDGPRAGPHAVLRPCRDQRAVAEHRVRVRGRSPRLLRCGMVEGRCDDVSNRARDRSYGVTLHVHCLRGPGNESAREGDPCPWSHPSGRRSISWRVTSPTPTGPAAGHAPATVEDPTHDAFNPFQWDRYLAQIDTVASSVPWMVAAGNHEHGSRLFSRRLWRPPGTILPPPERSEDVSGHVFLRLRQRRCRVARRQRPVVRDTAEPRLLRRQADGVAEQRARFAQEERPRRLHRGVLSPLRVLHITNPRLRGRHPNTSGFRSSTGTRSTW